MRKRKRERERERGENRNLQFDLIQCLRQAKGIDQTNCGRRRNEKEKERERAGKRKQMGK